MIFEFQREGKDDFLKVLNALTSAGNAIGSRGVADLCTALPFNNSLQTIDLRCMPRFLFCKIYAINAQHISLPCCMDYGEEILAQVMAGQSEAMACRQDELLRTTHS